MSPDIGAVYKLRNAKMGGRDFNLALYYGIKDMCIYIICMQAELQYLCDVMPVPND